MDASVAVAHTTPLAHELHASLVALEPSALRTEALPALRRRLDALRVRIVTVLDTLTPSLGIGGLQDALRHVADLLTDLPDDDLPAARARRAWKQRRRELLRAYGTWSRELAAWDIHVPHLRPFNPTRNLFHAAWASLAALTLGTGPDTTLLLAIIVPIFVWAWTMEFLRRRMPQLNATLMRWFSSVAHPHEWHRVNSATWYATALLGLTLAEAPDASMVALLVLGFGDPAAAIVGRRWGRTALLHGRTLEGTAAFAAVGLLVAWPALVFVQSLPPTTAFGMALAGSVAGAIAELLSLKIDDNLSIPWAAALGAWLLSV